MKTTTCLSKARLATVLIGAAVVLSALPGAAQAADKKFASLATTPLARGAGYEFHHGSRRVRYLQRQLRRLGARPGPIDGLFGPLTEGGVRRFQRRAGLRVDGLVGPKTATRLAHRIRILHRRAVARERLRQRSQNRHLPRTGGGAGNQVDVTTPGRTARNSGTLSLLTTLLLAAGSAAVLVLLFMTQTRRSRRPAEREQPAPRRAPSAMPVIGYVSLSEQERLVHGEDYGPQIEVIEAFCRQRGLRLLRIVRDVESTGHDASGLEHACQMLAGGQARGLVVQGLGRLTHSPARLAVLLRWLADSDRTLIAVGNALDTSTADGRVTAESLIEVGDWDHERAVHGRAANRRSSGRPAVHDLPGLHARIAATAPEADDEGER